jgi:guanylate kinase
MNNPLYLFVGKSGSGKTTAADLLIDKGFNQLESYTTRPPRYDGEIGHVFISNEEFDDLKSIVAYTEYNGHRYGATQEQVDNVSIYVIDVPGVETLLEKYQSDRPIVIMYFDTSIRTRIDRMMNRGDHDIQILSRIYNDEEFDWEGQLNKIAWHYKNNLERNVNLHTIDANVDVATVLARVVNYMALYVEESGAL